MTLGSHQTTIGKSQVHLTPKWIIDALGPFDLDPCANDPRPWDCAAHNWTFGGLHDPWTGNRVWLNPPFNRYEVGKWIQKLADHGNGIALLHARTETEWFRICWRSAFAILFMRTRLIFVTPDGTPCTTQKGETANSGAPPVLVAFGEDNGRRLDQFASRYGGALVYRWQLYAPSHFVQEAAE